MNELIAKWASEQQRIRNLFYINVRYFTTTSNCETVVNEAEKCSHEFLNTLARGGGKDTITYEDSVC